MHPYVHYVIYAGDLRALRPADAPELRTEIIHSQEATATASRRARLRDDARMPLDVINAELATAATA